MTSRTRQNQELRARRLAEERTREEQARRRRRLQMLGGVVVVAAVVVGVAIAISVGGSGSAPKPASSSARQAARQVEGLLAGIPQSGSTLGSPRAKVTLTEFADLKCPYCRAFTLGAESQLIRLQGDEMTSYVTPGFLEGLAGLDYAKWSSDRGSPRLAAQVAADQRAAQALGFTGTPSVLVQGPGGTRKIVQLGDYGTYESAIRAVQ